MDMESEVKYEDTPHSVVLHKTSPEFKRGFYFAMRCIIDMASNKGTDYTVKDLLDFLHNFLLVNRTLENIEKMKDAEKQDGT